MKLPRSNNTDSIVSILEQNLTNLHSFWSTMPFTQQGTWFRHNQWPHKLWQAGFDSPLSSNLTTIAGHVLVSTHPINSQLLPAQFTQSHLITMSLGLNDNTAAELCSKVTPETDFIQWANACGKAFGYQIDADVIEQLAQHSNNWILSLKVDEQIAVTAILHQTNSGFGEQTTFGLHQMGALTEFRGQGLAKKMMQHLIAFAKQQGASLLTLQASQAGLPLYEKLGFKAQVPLYSYRVL
ncbi:GNAT family N-acetyltransferase [Pseudoalteromonas tunicata]|uniref:GNAT family N-acetyltransferase n=1 Tax=Pseudoalteromonas tunicata TaxID=314281 RepID=UPI00273D6FBA|nr:GNAT family N-acetyltransferase [Pseudoalteromonas tunicata]MDP5213418.1 GNAT family N-acetyltransferase [Pseudoalteromonas tunicata]